MSTEKMTVLEIVRSNDRFQECIDTVVEGIRDNCEVINRKYKELLLASKDDYQLAEKTLVSKIITTVYSETKRILKKYDTGKADLKKPDSEILFNIYGWDEFKTFAHLVCPNNNDFTVEDCLVKVLRKYGLNEVIRVDYFPAFAGNRMTVYCRVFNEKTILDLV